MGTENWDPPLHPSEGALVEFRVVCQLTNRAESGGTLCGITVRRAQHNTAQHSTAQRLQIATLPHSGPLFQRCGTKRRRWNIEAAVIQSRKSKTKQNKKRAGADGRAD